ncbi:MAG: sigma-54 dependent transcriptional regulator [Acidobacteriia bacterium]|nr:sigma-54 dependent transcriptional regulator [Terriglobia bacterium]
MRVKQVLWIGGTAPRLDNGRPDQREAWHLECLLPEMAIQLLEQRDYDATVLDFPIPGWLPARLLAEVQRASPGTPVLIRDPGAALSDAVRLARLGVYQFFTSGEEALGHINQAIQDRGAGDLARLAANIEREEWERLLVGDSREMRQVGHLIRMVGGRRSTVLITGETGTGKEIAARALHLAGPRRHGPWVAVNCSALPENLLEAELFGHVKGAFTGAFQNRVGRFEQAQGGTLFLDEIGELPLDLQAKLLRVLQEREFQRLGSSETIRADVRVVAAANCDLVERIGQEKFREDLYYRLNVVPIHMPPLRQRCGDVPMLAAHFLDKICRAEEIPRKQLCPEAVERLVAYSWPGNVRQLENAVEMAVALSGDHTILEPADFPLPVRAPSRAASAAAVPFVPVPDDGLDYEQTMALIERGILEQALRKTGGNKKAAAEMLHLKRTTLSAKVRSLAAGRWHAIGGAGLDDSSRARAREDCLHCAPAGSQSQAHAQNSPHPLNYLPPSPASPPPLASYPLIETDRLQTHGYSSANLCESP